jgi:hypothetical protein
MLNGIENYYPLEVGCGWVYLCKDGSSYTNMITAVNPNNSSEFTMVNSLMNKNQVFRKEGDNYLTDSFQDGTMNTLLKDNAKVGDTWEIKFKANGIDSIIVMTVKSVGLVKDVKGKTFENVMMLEGESKMQMNGNLIPLNYFTHYYYCRGIGLILTTTSMGDEHALIDCIFPEDSK